MCYQNCCWENWHGECIHRPKDGPMPCNYEDDDGYQNAIKDAQDAIDDEADHKYEMQKDRDMGI